MEPRRSEVVGNGEPGVALRSGDGSTKMSGDLGWAEQAGEEGPRADKADDLTVVRQGRDSRAPSSTHLYIVHSSDGSQGSSPMERSQSAGRLPQSKCMLDRSVQGQIGRMLRDVFSDVADEPVPERFVKLLEALDAREKQS